jgi:large subunit ribosomal protein L18
MIKKKNNFFFQKKKRVFKKICGVFIKPRLSIFKSNKHIYAQLIDDENHQTLCCSSTLKKDIFKDTLKFLSKKSAFIVGKILAQEANIRGIKNVVFDRGNRPYHGLIKSLAEGAKSEGLIF